MIDSIKNMFRAPTVPQKMAGASFTLMGPFPSLGHVYALERFMHTLPLKGWMKLDGYNIEMELHGSFEAITYLIHQLDQGKVLQPRVRYEMMWLPYDSSQTIFTHRIYDGVSSISR